MFLVFIAVTALDSEKWHKYYAFLSPNFYLYKVHKKQNDNLAKIKNYSMMACLKAKFCYFSYEMLRISNGKETLTLKGDHLETNLQGF